MKIMRSRNLNARTMKPVIEVELSELHYTRAIGNYEQTTSAKQAVHTAVLETAFHFWRSVATWGELLCFTDNGEHRKIPTNHPWWTKAMNIIPRVRPKEQFFGQRLRVLVRR